MAFGLPTMEPRAIEAQICDIFIHDYISLLGNEYLYTPLLLDSDCLNIGEILGVEAAWRANNHPGCLQSTEIWAFQTMNMTSGPRKTSYLSVRTSMDPSIFVQSVG